jgi:putative peptide zinc metalloprotease protein
MRNFAPPAASAAANRLLIDTSEENPSYLLLGANRSYIKLSASAYHLLRSVEEGNSYEALAKRLTERQGREVSPGEVEAAHTRIVNQIADIERKAPTNPSGFWLRREIFPPAVVNAVAKRLAVAFHPLSAAGLSLFIAIGFAAGVQRHVFDGVAAAALHAGAFWGGYALFALSLFIHEFGHASACARYGARPSGVGFAAYLIYPALYSDVSAAWQLKRVQRVVVDAGGAFFQLVVGAGYALAYALRGGDHFKIAVVMIAANCLFSLNPILKFDGYWLLADALGVVNLARQPRRIFRHYWNRLRGVRTAALPWSPTVIAVLSVYSVVSVGFWAYFLGKLIPAFVNQVIRYPLLAFDLAQSLVNPPHAASQKSLHAFFLATYVLLFTGFFLWRAVVPPLRGLKAALRNRLDPRRAPQSPPLPGESNASLGG